MNADVKLEQLAEMWEKRDPMPTDLPDTVLVALALDDLDGDAVRRPRGAHCGHSPGSHGSGRPAGDGRKQAGESS